MQELVEAIKAWPVIVQGALGSALFWLILLVGQKLATRLASWQSTRSKRARRNWLVNERAKCLAGLAPSAETFATYATILLYRASRPLCRSLLWLVLGLAFEALFFPAGLVGYIGALYYLFKAIDVLGVIHGERHTQSELEKIDHELESLGDV
jgi:hypothetical protein